MDGWFERDRARLLELLTALSFERRPVKLASGRESDFYIDCRKTALTAEGHYLIGRLFLARLRQVAPEVRAVGGPTLGADPLVSAVSLTSYLSGHPLPAFIVRKEQKGHGTGAWLEGRTHLGDGWPVAVLEDTVTTGGSLLRAVERAEAEGLKVVHTLALVDRLEGGREAVEAKGYALSTLFTRRDFIP